MVSVSSPQVSSKFVNDSIISFTIDLLNVYNAEHLQIELSTLPQINKFLIV